MSFLTPIFLALGLLAGPIILLYMLRLRRREMVVSSTLLWQRLLRDREANAPWQKLRRNLLLLLQLLILTLLVVSLARPYLPVPSVVSGSVVVVIDGSASMLADDVAPDRFTTAANEVLHWIDELGSSDQMTLILAGPSPVVLAAATNDRRVLRAGLNGAEPASAPANWPAALALAAGAVQGARDARMVIISDGGLPADLPPLPAETIYVPVGNSGENLAITALATRNTETGPQLFAGVRNTGSGAQDGLLSIYLDDNLSDSRSFSLPAGEAATFTWNLSPDVTAISAQLSDQGQDHFPLDDIAWAVHEGGVSNRTLLVSPGSIFLEQLLSVLPGVQAFRAAPGADLAPPGEPGYELYVLDSIPFPDRLPAADLLLINPQPPASSPGSETLPVTFSGVFTNTRVTRLVNSPLLEYVDWGGVHVRRAQGVSAPGMQPLITAEGGPLLLVGEWRGNRVAILTFDLHDSDLPLQIAFPILMTNLAGWLNPGRVFDAPAGLQSGDPVALNPDAGSTHILVDRPDGSIWISEVTEEQTVFVDTGQPGLYAVRLRDENGERLAGQFAVNLFSPEESQIAPAPALQIGPTVLTEEGEESIGQWELWPWLAGIAVIVLVLEWWVHFRGTRLPQVRKSSS